MFYTIYKTTNNIDKSYYIGKHQTKDLDDGYMGSGKYLKRAIKKYGVNNFTKEITHIFDNETDMNAKEAELVNNLVVEDTNSYNLCPGGNGGFGYINKNNMSVNSFEDTKIQQKANKKANKSKSKLWKHDEEWNQKPKQIFPARQKNDIKTAEPMVLRGRFIQMHQK